MPTSKKSGAGNWGSKLESAGGSQTVVPKEVMMKGDEPCVYIVNHKGEDIGCLGSEPCCEKKEKCEHSGMSKEQKVMTVGA